MIASLKERVRETYKSALGMSRHDLITPALILDLDIAKLNIDKMTQILSGHRTKLRPHIKGQKSPGLARMQIEAGAIGVCTATVWEAIVMSRAGITDVFIANEVWGVEKIRSLAKEAAEGNLSVAVDNANNVDDLSSAVVAAGGELGIVVDVDVGMGRGGVRSVREALALAQHVENAPSLRFMGIMGYEGHCMAELNRRTRIGRAGEAVGLLGEIIERLAGIGLECKVVSAGGTGTYDISVNDSG